MEKIFFYCAMKFAMVRILGPGVPAKVKGDLVENGKDASGHNLGKSDNLIEGVLFPVPKQIVTYIDDLMGPTCRRTEVRMLDGKKAWAYEALTDCPKDAPKLAKWPSLRQLGYWIGGPNQ